MAAEMPYFIGGSLYLPDPTEELEGETLAWAKHLEPMLRSMHERDLSSKDDCLNGPVQSNQHGRDGKEH